MLLLAFLIGVFGLAAGHMAKFVQSVLTTSPHLGISGWYFVPAYLMEAIIVPARCYVAIWLVRRFIGRGRSETTPQRSSISSLAIIMIGAAFLFAKADFAGPFRFVDWFRGETSYEWEVSSFQGTMVMNRVLPEDSIIGSWDSGVVGYFSRFPVVNLDGLVNSWDFLRANKELPADAYRKEESFDAFHLRHRITVLANSRRQHEQHDAALFEGPLFEKKRNLQFKFWFPEWLRESWGGVDRAAWFRERMEPHLEHSADGVGFLVDGRIMQAFAQDCTPDVLAVWTWEADQKEMVFSRWMKTSIGFCTSFIVLPHDARPPWQAAVMTADEYLANRVGKRLPAIRSGFDVYLVENSLVYVKEPCEQEDVEALFFLGVNPIDPDNLPDHRRRHGFDNLDFEWDGPGAMIGGMCLAEVPLPEYDIAAIGTGQFVVTEDGSRRIWEGEIRFE